MASFPMTARWLALVLACLAGIVLVRPFGAGPARLEIVASANAPGALKVYFDTGEGFREAQSRTVRVGRVPERLVMQLPDDGIRRFRLDPHPKLQWMRFHDIRMPASVGKADGLTALTRLKPGKHVRRLTIEKGYVEVLTNGGNDPQLLLELQASPASPLPWLAPGAKALFWLLALASAAFGYSKSPDLVPRAAPWLIALAGVFALSMAFATSTTHPVHPDESSHVRAGAYYIGNWLPRGPLDPVMASTYDPIWGISYLNNLDIAYFFAGKLSVLWGSVAADPVIAMRLFNVSLLLALAAFAGLRREFAAALCVLLLTPQAWYVFAYFNGDALPLCLSFVAVALAATREGAVSQFIVGKARAGWEVGLFALVLGMLVISKRNYLLVAYFTCMLLAWRHLRLSAPVMVAGFLGTALAVVKASSMGAMASVWPGANVALGVAAVVLLVAAGAAVMMGVLRNVDARPAAWRMVLLMLLVGVVALPRVAVDAWTSGTPVRKAEQVKAAAEAYARPPFKPSTVERDLQSAHPGLRFAARGVSLTELLWSRNWIKASWLSSLGVYGYMDVYSPRPIYWILGIGVLVFGVGTFLLALRNSTTRGAALIGLSSLALVLLSSLFFSWFYGYQPQGRYLLPALPILGGIFAASVEDAKSSRLLTAALIACFLVSAVSFVDAIGRLA